MSRRMTLKEIYDMIQAFNKANNTNYFLLGKEEFYDYSFSWSEEYVTNARYLDKFQSDKRRSFLFCLDLDDTDSIAIEEFYSSVLGFMYTYKDSLNRMYKSLKESYSALDSNNMSEIYRIHTDLKQTNSIGSSTNTFENGAQSASSTSATSPWNEGESFTNTEKTESSNNSYTDKQIIGERIDMIDTDTNKVDERKKNGNTSAKTLQDLVRSEVNLRESIAFYDKLFEMLIRELFQFVDSGYDAFFIL